MNFCRLLPCFVGAVMIGLAPDPLAAAPAATAPRSTNRIAVAKPPLPPESPVDFFRRVLAMPPAEREKALAGRSAQVRTVVAARLKEFDALPAQERDGRLRSLQLRWYLLPLMKSPATNRAEQLARVPEGDRAAVAERLAVWDRLASPMQRELLDNEAVVRVFFSPDGGPPRAHTPPKLYPPQLRSNRFDRLDGELARWQALPETKRQEIYRNFQRFVELPAPAKQKTLDTLSETERWRMEQTLKMFERLPGEQRARGIAGFKKFAELSAADRAEFLTNADRWQAMTAREREAWRSLVNRLTVLKLTPPGARRVSPPPRPPVPAARSVALTNP